MKRRHFFGGLAAAAGVAACGDEDKGGTAGAAQSAETFEWSLVTSWPPKFPGLGMAPENLARRIETASNGRLKIKVYGGGELVPPFEVFDAVSRGTVEMGHDASYYHKGKVDAAQYFTAIPFGLSTLELGAWLYHGGGLDLWTELYAPFNLVPFPCGNTGVQMGGWFNKEINALEDFKGLRMRMPGLGGEVLRRMGATAIALPGGEIFSSLQSGAIDATEWVGPWNDLAFGFYKIAKYYYYPGFHEPGAQIAAGINLDVWHSLSKAHQSIIEQACAAENDYGSAEYFAKDTDALNTLINQHGVKLRRFSDEILTEMGRLSGIVAREAAEENELTGRIYQSFRAARQKAMEISAINVEPYNKARRLDFPY